MYWYMCVQNLKIRYKQITGKAIIDFVNGAYLILLIQGLTFSALSRHAKTVSFNCIYKLIHTLWFIEGYNHKENIDLSKHSFPVIEK